MIVIPHEHEHKALRVKKRQALAEDIKGPLIIATVSQCGTSLLSSREHMIENILVLNEQLSRYVSLSFIIRNLPHLSSETRERQCDTCTLKSHI